MINHKWIEVNFLTAFIGMEINKSRLNHTFLVTQRDALCMIRCTYYALNNRINTFLINSNIILYHVPFIKYLWISKMSLASIGLKSTEKRITIHFNPVFFILLNVKSFEISPKHSA